MSTGKPVAAGIYLIPGSESLDPTGAELVVSAVHSFELVLPSWLTGVLIAKADGYETWKVGINYDIKISRRIGGPIEIQPSNGI